MSRNVYLTRGLVGRDQDIDLFEQIFELSQLVTVETANPALDLISFAQNCSEFWVINTGHSVPSAVIVQETPPSGQSVSTPPNNCLGLHTTPCPAPSHELPHMSASHESITEDANLGEPLMEYLEPPHGAEDTASPTHQAPNLQLTDRNTGYSSFDVDRPSEDKNIAGFIYLQPSSHSQDELHFEEYSVGVILRPHCRGLGVAEKAMHLALDVAFARHDVHRVQARLIDCYENDKAFTFFTRMGFSHEGTRRQAFLSPLTCEWKDVTTLALLATDWLLFIRERRNDYRPAPKSLWDALFLRHQKEREELLRWEERNFYRNSSSETIRGGIVTPVPAPDISDVEATSPTRGSRSPGRPKRKLFQIGDADSTDSDAFTSEYGSGRESDYTSAIEDSPPKRLRSQRDEPYVTSPHNNNRANTDLGEEVEAHQGEIEGSPGCTATPKDEDAVMVQFSPDQLCATPDSSRSTNLRPDSRGSSVLSVPSSESETESEDGCASLSAESSNWELVDSSDIFGA